MTLHRWVMKEFGVKKSRFPRFEAWGTFLSFVLISAINPIAWLAFFAQWMGHDGEL